MKGLQPVILELRLLEDFLFFYFAGTDAVQEMRSCIRCVKMFVFFSPLNFRLQCERTGASSQGT